MPPSSDPAAGTARAAPRGGAGASAARLRRGLLAAAFALAAAAAMPAGAGTEARISIVIDDMGDRREVGLDAVALPGPVAFAFLPHTPHAGELARLAHGNGKEVLLHLPMQSENGNPLGPGAITANMDRVDLIRVVSRGLRSVPHVSGVSNHMGSLLTPRRRTMGWLMDLLRVRGNLFFLDSRTTARTAALDVARQRGVPCTWRDVFLDNDPGAPAVRRAFEALVKTAKRRGTALAIGHPNASTIQVLAEMIPGLEARGVRLVPVAELIARRYPARPPHIAAPRRSAGSAGLHPVALER